MPNIIGWHVAPWNCCRPALAAESSLMIDESAATLDDIAHWAPDGSCSSLRLLRLDLLHPVVSGNKWFKLKYNAEAATAAGKTALLTFGGGHSNHLVATAFAAQTWGFKSIGLVRGHYSGRQFTPALQACVRYGMTLVPLTKAAFAAASLEEREQAYPEAFVIPEGGANNAGRIGAGEIARLIPAGTTDICVPVGTGTTMKGLLAALPNHVRVHGFYVARDHEGMDSLARDMRLVSGAQAVIHPVADRRFGKWTPELLSFIRQFYVDLRIPLDVVYTAKMMMTVEDLLKSGYFGPYSRIVCLHTGGLQGNPPEATFRG